MCSSDLAGAVGQANAWRLLLQSAAEFGGQREEFGLPCFGLADEGLHRGQLFRLAAHVALKKGENALPPRFGEAAASLGGLDHDADQQLFHAAGLKLVRTVGG